MLLRRRKREVESTRLARKHVLNRFGEFDILAVSMHPSTRDWSMFHYTVANWLVRVENDSNQIEKLQPVLAEPDDLTWTADFMTAVRWFRSGTK